VNECVVVLVVESAARRLRETRDTSCVAFVTFGTVSSRRVDLGGAAATMSSACIEQRPICAVEAANRTAYARPQGCRTGQPSTTFRFLALRESRSAAVIGRAGYRGSHSGAGLVRLPMRLSGVR
jgi:hypothetical protein